jgi:Xaa-Pro aminopeptidase
MTEAAGADEMGRRRLSMNAIGDSFPTISSAGPNASVIHYQASHRDCADISAEQIYLLDTGGQYEEGTTDVTRTVSLRYFS